jgi:hypothetical protein
MAGRRGMGTGTGPNDIVWEQEYPPKETRMDGDDRDALLWCLCIFGGSGFAIGFLIAFGIWGA